MHNFRNIKRVILNTLFILSYAYFYGQNPTFSYLNRTVDTLFTIKSPHKNYDFPIYENFNIDGLSIEINDLENVYEVVPHSRYHPSKKYALNFQCYSENIKEILFYVKKNLGQPTDTIIQKISKDGFSIPLSIKINSKFFERRNLSKLVIAIKLNEQSRKYKLSLKNFFVGEETIEVVKDLPSRVLHSDQYSEMKYSKYDSYGIYKNFPVDEREEEYKGTLIYYDEQEKNIRNSFFNLMYLLLDKYQYYKERKASKRFIIKKVKELEALGINNEYNIENDVRVLDSILQLEINDPHFKIISQASNANDSRKRTPIYCYKIDTCYYVAANFDDTLKKKIPIGSKILKINNTYTAQFGNSKELNKSLKKKVGEIVTLRVELQNGEERNVRYEIKSRYEIPNRFKSKNLEIQVLSDSIVYYKINKIDYSLPVNFVNNYSVFNNAKKIVLDLRGCSGGDFLALSQFLSYLINDEFILYNLQSRFQNGQIEPVTVKKNDSKFKLSSILKIRVLVDNDTTCAAELLAFTIKKHISDTLILGNQETKGALTIGQDIHLQGTDIKIKTNSLSTGKILLNNLSIENRGILPDIRIPIRSVFDLKPYNDTVLQEAIIQ
jgi:C-terminal processing protease CtpA/Prc